MLRELGVVSFIILPADPLFRHSGGSSRLKNIVWSTLISFGNKLSRILFSEDFIIEIVEVKHIRKGLNPFTRIPTSILCPVQPIGATGLR